MFKQLVLMAIFSLSIGTSVASFSRPAHAAIDSYMFFQDYDDGYFDDAQDE
jgi:hypothetical protein